MRASTPTTQSGPDSDGGRLNLLLSYGGWREEAAVNQLPRLLAPMGIRSIRVGSGDEAASVIREAPVHIAVVDLSIPLSREAAREAGGSTPGAGGVRILQLLRRLDAPPPTVVIRPMQSCAREHARGLAAALREGAFAVLDDPMEMETLLETMRRILRRHYADAWPDGGRPSNS